MFQRQGIWFRFINQDAEMWAMKSMLLERNYLLGFIYTLGINLYILFM